MSLDMILPCNLYRILIDFYKKYVIEPRYKYVLGGVCGLILTQFCTSESIVIINSEYQNRM